MNAHKYMNRNGQKYKFHFVPSISLYPTPCICSQVRERVKALSSIQMPLNILDLGSETRSTGRVFSSPLWD